MNKTFARKLFYLAAIAILLVPLYVLGNPSVSKEGDKISAGGTLSQLREQYNLGQGDLGKLDPASESARLATLGLRGVATTIMWHKANQYKVDQNWDRFSASLNQIALLQPHSIKVWEFQGHNLAFNVSVEFDDYRQRYNWVKKGTKFTIRGTDFNRRDANLPWFVANSLFGTKLGKSDERVQFRRLFRNDNEYHAELGEEGTNVLVDDATGFVREGGKLPDPWLVSKIWYGRSYDIVEKGRLLANTFRKAPLQFFSGSPLSQMAYCEAIENEGVLDNRAKLAWQGASADWSRFGNREIPTTFGHTIYLNQLSTYNEKITALEKKFEALVGDLKEKLLEERRQALTPQQRVALAKEGGEMTDQEMILAREASDKLNLLPREIAKRMPDDKRLEAIELAVELEKAREYREHVDLYRNQVNFNYWETRCEAEQLDTAIEARQKFYEAEKLANESLLDEAIAAYDEAWVRWDKLFRLYPVLMIDDAADDVFAAIKRYRLLLDKDLPPDFVLKDFIDFRERYEQGGPDFNMLLEMSNMRGKAGDKGNFDDLTPLIEPNKAPTIPIDPKTGKPMFNPPTTGSSPPVDAPPASEPTATEPAKTEPAKTEPATIVPPDAGEAPAPPAGDGSGTSPK